MNAMPRLDMLEPTLAVSPCISLLVVARYTFPKMQLFREIREDLIWADGGAVKKATDEAILNLLGPKTEADEKASSKKPAKKAS